jgi:hypothetical protein
MPELRWILTAFGVVLLIGIYAWGRRGSKSATAADDALVRMRPEAAFETRDTHGAPDFAESEPAGYVEEEAPPEVAAIEGTRSPPPARPYAPARANALDESKEITIEVPVQRPARDLRYSRIEPTFGEESATQNYRHVSSSR